MDFNWEIKFRMLTVNISRRVRDMKTEMDVKPEVDYISRKNHFHVPEAITNIQKIFQNVNLKLEKWWGKSEGEVDPEVERGSEGSYLAAHRGQPCQGGMAILLMQQLN